MVYTGLDSLSQTQKTRVCLLMGFLVFSPISSLILIGILHFPFSLPELLFIPFIPYFKVIFISEKINSRLLIAGIMLWLVLLGISLIVDEYSLKDILGSSRTYLYIFIFFSIFFSQNKNILPEMYILSLGALFGWSIDALYNFFILLTGEISISYGPMIALPIIIGYPYAINHKKKSFLFFIISIIIGVIGTLRRVIAVSIIVFLISVLKDCFRSIKSVFRTLGITVSIGLILGLSYPFIRQTIQETSHDMYVRIILKSEDIFNGKGNSGDNLRNDIISNFYNNFLDYTFPHGYVSKNYGGENTDGTYNDFPIREIAHTFSLLPLLFGIIYFLFKTIKCSSLIQKNRLPQSYFVLILGIFTIFILLNMEGSFLTFPYQTIYSGYILGTLSRI